MQNEATREAFDETSSPFTRSIGRPRTVLDVGGGIGIAGEVARRRGTHITSVALEGRRAPAGTFDELVNAGTLEATLKAVAGRTFDLICLNDVLDDSLDPRAMLEAFAGLLVDGGHLNVDLPMRGHAMNGSAAHAPPPSPSQPVRSLRRDNAVKCIEDSGLEVMRVDPVVSHKPLASLFLKVGTLLAPEAAATREIIVCRKPPRTGRLDLTVGMLTLNESESVEKMIDEIRVYAPDAKIMLIDSSSDETPELARAKGAQVIRQLPPRGHGPAMQRLMYEAAAQSDALIYLDCDFTYPTDTIPLIRQLLEGGADVVNTSRTHRYPDSGAMPVPNFIANRFFAATAQAVHGVPTTDVHSGMRGYRSSVIRAFDFPGTGDALPLHTLILPAKSHYHVVEVPIPYRLRVGVSKLARLRGTVWTFARIASAIGRGSRVREGVRYRHIE